jgi:hypothetical protein
MCDWMGREVYIRASSEDFFLTHQPFSAGRTSHIRMAGNFQVKSFPLSQASPSLGRLQRTRWRPVPHHDGVPTPPPPRTARGSYGDSSWRLRHNVSWKLPGKGVEMVS